MRILFKAKLNKQVFNSGELAITIITVDDAQSTSQITTTVSLPPAFHMHNDCLAVALATFCGKKYPTIQYDFPISKKACDAISKHCSSDVVAPSYIEPRSPGAQNALNFSGGFDSLSAYLILPPEKTNLISMDFGGDFARERDGFNAFNPAVICKTDFRKLGLASNDWRFMAFGSLINADYLNLGFMAFGSIFEATPWNFSPRLAGRKPTLDLLFGAVGIQDYSPIRGLTEIGTAMIVLSKSAHLADRSLASLASPGTEKMFRKKLIIDIVHHRYYNGPKPDFDSYTYPKNTITFGKSYTVDFLTLYFISLFGIDTVSRWVSGLDRDALAWAEKTDLSFYERYNPNFINGLPPQFRCDILHGYSTSGILPYHEGDWASYNKVKDFLSQYYSIPA